MDQTRQAYIDEKLAAGHKAILDLAKKNNTDVYYTKALEADQLWPAMYNGMLTEAYGELWDALDKVDSILKTYNLKEFKAQLDELAQWTWYFRWMVTSYNVTAFSTLGTVADSTGTFNWPWKAEPPKAWTNRPDKRTAFPT